MRHRITTLAVVAVLGCSPVPKHPINVAVLLDGEHEAALAPRAVAGLELVSITPPTVIPAPLPAPTAALAAARGAYAQGRHESCRNELARIDVPALLAAGHRAAAARALTLDAACAYQGLGKEDARAGAARMAGFGLELPADAVAAEVEQLIDEAIVAANRSARTTVAVRGQAGARVAIDGRAAMCVVPCPVELAPGDHVIAVDADGFEPAWRVVRVPDSREVTIEQTPASAARATEQWHARIGRGLPAADAIGARLLSRIAGGHTRVAYLHAGTQLAGTMIVDGVPRASASAARGAGPRLVRELAYDAKILARPRVWQRPWFWIVLGASALAVSGAVVYFTYEPEVRTMVVF